MNFWDELTLTEREALTSIAERETFPRGATLFDEGESADHVVVIRSGWTKICVHENGRERLLAERGPGELVGERAALEEDNERSATVVALDTVEALVLRTSVFKRFISRYPRVLKIVQDLIYNRLTQSQGPSAHRERLTVPETRLSSAPVSGNSPDARLNGHSCTIVMTDIAEFGANYRKETDREHIRREFRTIMPDAFVHAGIAWNECHFRDRGDGLLVVVPPTVPPATVMRALNWLAAGLKSHDRAHTPPAQIQLRVAVHVGPVTLDDLGLDGATLILAARLLEAPVLKTSMAETGARLGVIASDPMYDTVIKGLDIEGFSKVSCKVKESRFDAWMYLTEPALPQPDAPRAALRPTKRQCSDRSRTDRRGKRELPSRQGQQDRRDHEEQDERGNQWTGWD